jgi:hypothetical protein
MAKNPGHPQTLKPRGEPGPGRPKGSKNKLTRAMVENELRVVAMTNAARLMFGNGKKKYTLREIAEMPDELQRCIASVKVKTENITAGDDKQDETVEIRLWPKVQALELCARSLGMLKDKVEISAPEELLSRLDRAKLRARKPE